MRRVLIILPAFFILLFAAVPMRANADSSSDEAEISSQVDELLRENDVGYSMEEIANMSFRDIWNELCGSISERAGAPLKMLGMLLIVIVFMAVVRGAGGGMITDGPSSQMYDMVCVITAVTVILQPLTSVYSRSLEAIELAGGFIAVFVPVLAGIMIASGGVTSGGVYNIAALTASEMTVGLSRSYLVPLLGLTAALAISGSVFPNASVDSMINLIKRVVTWGMTVVMTLFTGFVTLKCSLAAKADGAASKTVRFMISGFVPYVGNAVSDAYATVRGSFDVIGSTVGTAGIIAVLLIMLGPVAEIVLFRLVLCLCSAAAEMFSAAPIAKLMRGLDSGLSIAQSVLICYTVMFIISTAILIQ